jgi:hypothetical protein
MMEAVATGAGQAPRHEEEAKAVVRRRCCGRYLIWMIRTRSKVEIAGPADLIASNKVDGTPVYVRGEERFGSARAVAASLTIQ